MPRLHDIVRPILITYPQPARTCCKTHIKCSCLYEMQCTMALPRRIELWEKHEPATTFYEKFNFKLLYLIQFFFLHLSLRLCLRYKSECRIKYFFSLILTFSGGSIKKIYIPRDSLFRCALCKKEKKKLRNDTKNMVNKLVSCIQHFLVIGTASDM